MTAPYHILDKLRAGAPLAPGEVAEVAAGAADGSWTDAQLGAFLMGVTVRGLDTAATGALTRAMVDSGERWDLRGEFPGVVDKHSTGGVADGVSLILAPLLAACGVPVVMLTGRGLGHTGGTTDKLESIPGFSLDLDRDDCRRLLAEHGVAVGMPTGDIAPADGRLYALRDVTATIRSLPLITASILSKKLATGAEALVFDVKAGNGAFLTEREEARELARGLVDTCKALGHRAAALITDMSQPLGEWCGHTAEVRATLECLEGEGAADLLEVTLALATEVCALAGHDVGRADLEAALASGRARETFDEWAAAQGADPAWLASPDLTLAPVEAVVEAEHGGVLAWVDTRQLGLLLAEAGGGRAAGGGIDHAVSLRYRARLGRGVAGRRRARPPLPAPRRRRPGAPRRRLLRDRRRRRPAAAHLRARRLAALAEVAGEDRQVLAVDEAVVVEVREALVAALAALAAEDAGEGDQVLAVHPAVARDVAQVESRARDDELHQVGIARVRGRRRVARFEDRRRRRRATGSAAGSGCAGAGCCR